MSHQSDLIRSDIEGYLRRQERKELLRFLTCGSVDDGKSTLIGRLLHDSNLIHLDQLEAVERDSVRQGTTGGEVDLALLLDGLKAEREQGITIDVAYRYFSTEKRKFIIADTPGHEQYTRNMVTGASNCDLAVILIDARNGVVQQTKRHSFIASLLGIPHLVVAVNKMDLVDFSEDAFAEVKAGFSSFAGRLGVHDVHFIPLSARFGDNVVERSERMPWYQGGPLMDYLETVHIAADRNLEDLRFPVQYVNRPDSDFRGYCGTVASGIVRVGDEIAVLPSGKESRVASILSGAGALDEAFADMAVTLTLTDDLDVSRGDMIVHRDANLSLVQHFDATVVWMDDEPLAPGKPYLLKHTTKVSPCSVSAVRNRIDIHTLAEMPADGLRLNEIGTCQITSSRALACDPYRRNRATGAAILIDRLSNRTVGAALIRERSGTSHPFDWTAPPPLVEREVSDIQVGIEERQDRYGQKPATVFLTGITGSGKSTVAFALERRLFDMGRMVCILDANQLRLGLSRDLGFSHEARAENVRRSAEVARLLNDAGMICIAAHESPRAELRAAARMLVGEDRFLEIHLVAPTEICRERSPRLYELADQGELEAFPGVSAPYDPPSNPDLRLDTESLTVEQSVDRIVDFLRERGLLDG